MGQNNDGRVLLVGDRTDLADTVTAQLEAAGWPSIIASNGEEALHVASGGAPDVVVIVLPLHHENGAELCTTIRSESAVPIVCVTGRGSDQGLVDTLEAGADDYIAKPFSPRELVARIEAAIRRANIEPYRNETVPGRPYNGSHGVLQAGNVRLDLTTCRVSVNGKMKTLTPNEFRLMAVFMRAPGEVFTREELRKRVWPDDQHSLHLVEVHIANLRAKIEVDPHHPVYVVTVRSRGYKFAVQN